MRYRFGLKELIFVLLGVCATALLCNVDFGISVNSCRIIKPELIVSAFLAFTSGPIVGGLVGFLGYVLGRLIPGLPYMWGTAFSNMVVGLGVGLYAASYNAYKGEFEGIRILLFNIIQTITCSFAFLLVYPLISIIVYRINTKTALQTGISIFLCSILMLSITVTLLGMLYNAYMRVKLKKRETQKEK